MGESSLSELLECIKDDYFERSQQALAAAMGMKPPQLSRVMNAAKPKLTTERIVKLLNYLDTHHHGHTVTFDWLMRGKPRGAVYTGAKDVGLSGSETEMAEMTESEFVRVADRFGIECRRRGHKVASRALMDLVDAFDTPSSAAGVPSHPKVSAAVADLSQARSAKQPKH